MFEKELVEILKEVITSWQVIAAAIAILIYLNIVFSVSRAYRRPKAAKKVKIKPAKAAPAAEAQVVEDGNTDGDSDSDSNEDLGLEEA